MTSDAAIFTDEFKETPYWWEAAPRPQLPERALSGRVDVAVVGSGHTGLAAALLLARGGRHVALFEAGDPGQGASSRNAGYVGRSLKHSFAEIMEHEGLDRAIAVYRDMRAAFDIVLEMVEQEQIGCDLARCGRFIGALSARHYEKMAREYTLQERHLGEAFEMVPRAAQHREIGSDHYHGGAIIPDHGSLHPGLYQLGLLARAINAGADIHAHTPVTAIRRESDGFAISTSRGRFAARQVLVATNGYTGAATPWIRRRLVPFHGYMIATEPLPAARIDRVLPRGRTVIEFRRNIFYLRRTPDGTRLLFGGYTGGQTADLKHTARRLHTALTHILPDLADVRLTHAWTGRCAATFDLYPHIGSHDGIHYAAGYCFAGLPMGTWLGRQAARRILGAPDATTAFDALAFRSMPFYRGDPWFVPLVMKYYDWQDRRSL